MHHSKAIPISEASDPRIAAYVSVRERDLTGRDERFIVEGKVTLGILLKRSRFDAESVFLSETRLEPLADIVAAVPDHVPIYTAPQSLMNEIVGFPIHRGVLACGLKGEMESTKDLLTARTSESSTLLVLCGLSNHDNVGAAFRNAAAFGADALLLDETSCDPFYRKSIRVSAGTALWLPFTHGGSASDILNTLEANDYVTWSLTPREDAAPLQSLARPGKLALILGAEGPGLPDEIIARTVPVRIPMTPGFDSINVATAGAIALAQIFTEKEI